MPTLPFTVDSALLRELGERLVGRPEVALAELIKNGYDADSTRVEVSIAPGEIAISDNGQGMTLDEFTRYWMRIGSTHKGAQGLSRKLHRPLTGQKGVGRLAAQFLGSELTLNTVAEAGADELEARTDWAHATRVGELTSATVDYNVLPARSTFAGGCRHGTRLLIKKLHHAWTAPFTERLAREIWNLQPPFAASEAGAAKFEIALSGPGLEGGPRTDALLRPQLAVWHARIFGHLTGAQEDSPGRVLKVVLEFSSGERVRRDFPLKSCPLSEVRYEVRIYSLHGRKGRGVRLNDLREYLRRFGGVHIYDCGFHLPYYGPETDWLRIEIDHSHRLSKSRLLPGELQVERGLNYLPTNSRILGVVRVDTAREQRLAADPASGRPPRDGALDISITRDRLTDNAAYETLRDVVRTGVDLYAMREAEREFERAESEKPVVRIEARAAEIEALLDGPADALPKEARAELRRGMQEIVAATKNESRALAASSGILGALATAGIAAVASEHEISKQFAELETIASKLLAPANRRGSGAERGELGEQLLDWVARAKSTWGLFSSLSQQENRERRERFRAGVVLERVWANMASLRRATTMDPQAVAPGLRLPPGTFAEWTAIFQNVLLNAANATLDTRRKAIVTSSNAAGRSRAIVIQDTGVGIDLAKAEDLFRPFRRGLALSADRRALGLGGTGLGLTIVRMVAEQLGCSASFIRPSPGYSTAFQLSWREK